MTTATQKILTQVYQVDPANFSFELMYMPMDSNVFRNDVYAEVCAVIGAFALYTIIQLGSRVVEGIADPEEQRITEKLRRAGLRKSAEIGLEFVFLGIIGPITLPVLCYFLQQ